MPNEEGQAVVEYQLVVPDIEPVTLGAHSISHVDSTFEDTVYGTGRQQHKLVINNIEFVDDMLKRAMATGTPRLRTRLGVGAPQSMYWLPWQEHLILSYSASLESGGEHAGHVANIVTEDGMRILARGSTTRAHKGTVSKIVNDIATEVGIKNVVIEPTVGEGIYIQSLMSNFDFIRTRMTNRARNDKGRGSYLFFFKDNALHFHSPDYQPEFHDLSYSQSNNTALTLFDNSQPALDAGMFETRMMVYDPYTGQAREVASDPKKALRYADTIYSFQSVPNAGVLMPYHQGTNPPGEIDAIGQSVYERARTSALSLVLEAQRLIHIRQGDLVNLVLTPTNNKSSVWSGVYLVTRVKHVVIGNAVTTNYALSRGEVRKSRKNTTASGSDNALVNEQTAPGQDINIREVKSSQRTKGAGNSSVNGRLFVDVQQPS